MKPIATLRQWLGFGDAKKETAPMPDAIAATQPDEQPLTEVTLPNKRVAFVDARGNFRGFK